MENKEQVVAYSSLNRRVVAAAIDLFVIMMLMYVISNPLQNLVYRGKDFNIVAAELESKSQDGREIELSDFIQALYNEGFIERYMLLQLIVLGIMCLYTAFFWIKYDTTPGKWFAGCKIVDSQTLQPASKKQKIVRLLSYFVSAFTIIGFPMIAFTKKSEGLHDKIAGTSVINFKHDFSLIHRLCDRVAKR